MNEDHERGVRGGKRDKASGRTGFYKSNSKINVGNCFGRVPIINWFCSIRYTGLVNYLSCK